MKKYITLLSLLFGLVLQAQIRDNFTGEWTADDGSVITIYIQDASYYAKADGQYVLIQMERKSETKLYGGTYYDGAQKTEFEAKLKLTDDNTIRVKVLNGLAGKTVIWKRFPLELEKKDNEIVLQR